MGNQEKTDSAVGLLEQLGLKQYQAKSFVALSRVPQATAKEISEISGVPRTRVYDAVRALESKGLIEIQHTNPQQFRATSIDEAVETIRQEYDDRAEDLRETLRGVDSVDPDTGDDTTHEVWARSGRRSITKRTQQFVDEADQEVTLVLGDETRLTEGLVDSLRTARQRGIEVVVGTGSEEVRADVADSLPEVETVVSDLGLLRPAVASDEETDIGRLLLADRNTVLISSYIDVPKDDERREQAAIGKGVDNSLVVFTRRVVAAELLSPADLDDVWFADDRQ